MIKIIYIPTGEYLKFRTLTFENRTQVDMEITLKEYHITLSELLDAIYSADFHSSSEWLNLNNIQHVPILKEELEVIYD